MISEEALEKSFANVKRDITRIQANILEISNQQARLFKMFQEIRDSVNKKGKSTKKKTSKKKRKNS